MRGRTAGAARRSTGAALPEDGWRAARRGENTGREMEGAREGEKEGRKEGEGGREKGRGEGRAGLFPLPSPLFPRLSGFTSPPPGSRHPRVNPTLAPGIREKSFTFLPAEGNYCPAPDAGPNTGNRRARPRSWVLSNRRFGRGTDFRKCKTNSSKTPNPPLHPRTPRQKPCPNSSGAGAAGGRGDRRGGDCRKKEGRTEKSLYLQTTFCR